MLVLKRICLLFLFSLFLSANVFAVEADAKIPSKLRVGLVEEMPFAQNIDGHYSGIAIDMWDDIAAFNHWDFVYVPVSDNIKAELQRLGPKGDLDIIIGPISVDSARLESVDFTRPFFLSSIGVITKKHELNIFDVFKTFFSRILLLSILILFLSFVVFLHILWILERGKMDGVSSNYYKAFTKEIWQHLSKKGLSMPSTLFGRLLTLLWIGFAAAVITSINANYTAAMTVSLGQSSSKINTMDDLHAVKVAGVLGQLNVETAENNGIYVEKVKTFEEAMQLLLDNKVAAVVCDAPVGIEYLRLHGETDYILSPLVIENDEVAFAVKLDSPIRHKVDLGITKLQDNTTIMTICKRYIGDQAVRCDM